MLSNLSLDEYLSDETSYAELLKDGHSVQQVPLLNYANLQYFPDNTLVRFRGMVQVGTPNIQLYLVYLICLLANLIN